MKKVLIEGLLVALAGAVVAFLANAISPHGLSLTRDYHLTHATPAGGTSANRPATGLNTNSPTEILAANLNAVGLQLIDSNQVLRLFHDPRREQDLLLFVDAREEDHYQAGHIPGAFEFNNFHPEKYLTTVIPACQTAQQIVVYCNGGDCDESKVAALTLRDFLSGTSKTNLLIYGGGMNEWTNNRLPTELGERNSGRLVDAAVIAGPAH